MFRLTVVLCLVPALWLLAQGRAAPAADGTGPASRELEILRLREEIYSLNLINRLDLTGNQIAFILDQSELARPFLAIHREALPGIYAAQRVAFAEFKAEDEADQGFSPQVEQNTARAVHLEKSLEEKLIARLNQVAEPIHGILTETQLRLLAGYKPVLFPEETPSTILGGDARWRVETVREALLEALGLSEKRFNRDREKLARRIINALPPNRIGAGKGKEKGGKQAKRKAQALQTAFWFEDREEAVARICEAMSALRELPEGEGASRIDAFIQERIFPTKAEQLRREISRIQRSKHAELTPAARFLLNQDAVPYLAKLKDARPKGPPVGVR